LAGKFKGLYHSTHVIDRAQGSDLVNEHPVKSKHQAPNFKQIPITQIQKSDTTPVNGDVKINGKAT